MERLKKISLSLEGSGVVQNSNQTVHGTDSASQCCVAKQGGKVSMATPKSRKRDVLVLHSSSPKKNGGACAQKPFSVELCVLQARDQRVS